MGIFHACDYSHSPILSKYFVFQKLTLTSAFQIKLSGCIPGVGIALRESRGSQGEKSVSVHSSLVMKRRKLLHNLILNLHFVAHSILKHSNFLFCLRIARCKSNFWLNSIELPKSQRQLSHFSESEAFEVLKKGNIFQGWFNDSMRGDPDETWEGLDPDDIGDWQNLASALLSSSLLFHNEQHFDKN